MAPRRRLTAHDVFTPSSFPEHTYVSRGDEDLEAKLRFALATKGQIASLSGPSKSGKTVLVEKVVGKENLVPVVGAGVREPEQIWTRVLDWLEAPEESTRSRGNLACLSESYRHSATSTTALHGSLQSAPFTPVAASGSRQGTVTISPGGPPEASMRTSMRSW